MEVAEVIVAAGPCASGLASVKGVEAGDTLLSIPAYIVVVCDILGRMRRGIGRHQLLFTVDGCEAGDPGESLTIGLGGGLGHLIGGPYYGLVDFPLQGGDLRVLLRLLHRCCLRLLLMFLYRDIRIIAL